MECLLDTPETMPAPDPDGSGYLQNAIISVIKTFST